MNKYANFISKKRILVLIIAIILLIPSIIGIATTKINYDLLSYLPQNLDSVKGQDILDKTFSNAATGMLIIKNMDSKDVVALKSKISQVNGVDQAIWVDDLTDTNVPKEILPDQLKKTFYSKDSTLMLIKFKGSSSSESTMNAITDIRKVSGKQCFLSGMSAIVKDTKDLADKEAPFYVMIAVLLCAIVLSLTMESVFIPFIFLIGIGFAIIYNMGTNVFLGSISYVTKSLAAVLQLGVTMDFSIFLLHRYQEEKKNFSDKESAMTEAISKTIVAIGGSCLTTTAGFLALCSMNLLIGKDIGIVMAKGVVLGFISTITILPALILVFDKPINRFNHKTILPSFKWTSEFVTKHYKVLLVIFVLAFIPAIIGKQNAAVYYNLDRTLPATLPSIQATNMLKSDYNMTTTHFIVMDSNTPDYKIKEMADKLTKVDGINNVVCYQQLVGPSIPSNFIPENLKENFQKDGHKVLFANSTYKAASDEETTQINSMNTIIKSYDKNAAITGEGALTKDLIQISNKDFINVDVTSILAIGIIILLVFMSFSIPVILVLSIELAIFINMAIPFYTGAVIPYIASIVIGCIQLGSTVNYAILMTTRFREEVARCENGIEAIKVTIQGTSKSIVASALTFMAATAGVAIVSTMDMIRSLCVMMARGAFISTIVIIFILPAILLVSEKFIAATSKGWKIKNKTSLNLVGEEK